MHNASNFEREEIIDSIDLSTSLVHCNIDPRNNEKHSCPRRDLNKECDMSREILHGILLDALTILPIRCS